MTNYAHVNALEARQLIRSGKWRHPTTGMALGFVQANMVILPQSWAEEFSIFCRLNSRPALLLDVTAPGNPRPMNVAPSADIRTDISLYRVYRKGELIEEPQNLLSYWRDDFVTFLLGCSFTAEGALLEHGIPLRHIEQGKNVAMYKTLLPCIATPHIHGSLVVSMRPIQISMIDTVSEITSHYPLAHGAPIHVGDPAALGITQLAQPDWGDAIQVAEDEVPVFWTCGVTPQAVIMESKPEIALTHSPGHMFITDLLDSTIYQDTNASVL